MPIYEYECEACAHEVEVLQKISDPLLSDCPECGEPSLRKRISAPSFRLKGGGWYETDFKTGSKRNLAGEAATDAKKSDGDKPAGDGGKADNGAKAVAKDKPAASGKGSADD